YVRLRGSAVSRTSHGHSLPLNRWRKEERAKSECAHVRHLYPQSKVVSSTHLSSFPLKRKDVACPSADALPPFCPYCCCLLRRPARPLGRAPAPRPIGPTPITGAEPPQSPETAWFFHPVPRY